MDKFKEWFVSQYFYTNMRFVHGDALFDKDGDFFRILAVQIAWEAWQSRQAEVEEKDKRIEELERSCISYKNQRDDYAQKLMVKSVHYSSIQEELAKLKDRLELAHHLATQSTWSSLKQLKKVVKALRGEHE